MKYIFISYPFDIVDVDVFFYIVSQILKSLTLIKYYMHPILEKREYISELSCTMNTCHFIPKHILRVNSEVRKHEPDRNKMNLVHLHRK
jgi:hypothetical protein